MQMRRCKSFLRPSNVSLNEKGFKIKTMFSIKQRNRTERTLQVLTNEVGKIERGPLNVRDNVQRLERKG